MEISSKSAESLFFFIFFDFLSAPIATLSSSSVQQFASARVNPTWNLVFVFRLRVQELGGLRTSKELARI
jgi:hypothetical protein